MGKIKEMPLYGTVVPFLIMLFFIFILIRKLRKQGQKLEYSMRATLALIMISLFCFLLVGIYCSINHQYGDEHTGYKLYAWYLSETIEKLGIFKDIGRLVCILLNNRPEKSKLSQTKTEKVVSLWVVVNMMIIVSITVANEGIEHFI